MRMIILAPTLTSPLLSSSLNFILLVFRLVVLKDLSEGNTGETLGWGGHAVDLPRFLHRDLSRSPPRPLFGSHRDLSCSFGRSLFGRNTSKTLGLGGHVAGLSRLFHPPFPTSFVISRVVGASRVLSCAVRASCRFSRSRDLSVSSRRVYFSLLLSVHLFSALLDLSLGPLLVGTSPRFRCQSSSRLYSTSRGDLFSSGPLHGPPPTSPTPFPLPPPPSFSPLPHVSLLLFFFLLSFRIEIQALRVLINHDHPPLPLITAS